MSVGPFVRATATATFELAGDRMLATFVPRAHVTAADAREHMAVMRELTGGRRVDVIVDTRRVASQDRGARALYAGEEASAFTRACAIVVESPVSRIIGSFFMRFNKPRYPTRLVRSIAEAEAWLRSVK